MMNAVVKPYHEMCLNSSELIVPRDTYPVSYTHLDVYKRQLPNELCSGFAEIR